MTGQKGLWDEEERLEKLAEKKPSLRHLTVAIPWETFRPLLESTFPQERKSSAGRKGNAGNPRFKPIIRRRKLNDVIDRAFSGSKGLILLLNSLHGS